MVEENAVIARWGFATMLIFASLMAAAFVCWLHEHGIHPSKSVIKFLHRPLGEVLIVLVCVGAFVHHGATKGFLGGPRMMAPREMQTRLVSEPETAVPVAGMFSTYTNAVTNVCATGIKPAETSVFLRAHWPSNLYPALTGIEVYAAPQLSSNAWVGVGTATVDASDNSTIIEIPYPLLPDGWASSMFFMFGLNIDTDGDGLSDAFERIVTKTNPDLADTDGDGMPDGWEYSNGLNPLSDPSDDEANADADGDGLSNIDEYRYGTHPGFADFDNDGLDDRQEIGVGEELRGEDFLWFDTTGHASALGNSSSYDSVRTKIPLPFGVEVNGVCYTNAQIDLDGLVTLIHPDKQSSGIGTGYSNSGGVSNHLWSADHVTIAAYNTDVYVRPRENDWGSAFTYGTVTRGGLSYSVVEYRNVSHYNLGSSTSARMTFQVILPANETNVVYVSYLNVDADIPELDRPQTFGVQLPATNCVPGRGVYANVPWNKYSGCFSRPLTLKYWLGTGTDPNSADVDEDGLNDPQEVFVYHSDPYRADTDGDRLNDGREVTIGTDVNNPDTDGDGMEDAWEVLNGTDPLVDDAAGDPDWDGLVNIWEYRNGTDPHNEDSDGDMLADGVECGWYEDAVANVPWFTIDPLATYAPTSEVDKALIGCPMPFTNRLSGCRIDVALADVNGVVYFGRADATNNIISSDSGLDLSVARDKYCATVAAYWTDLKMRPTLGSSITFGTAVRDGTNRFFVVQYLNVGTYSGNGNSISFQMSIPEKQPDLVYVRYGMNTDSRSSGYVSIGAQGAKVGDFGNRPCLGYLYQSSPPVLEAGQTLAFHFGAGSDPSLTDTDEDGLDDRVEFIIGTNPRKVDTDDDGFDDADEIQYGLSPISDVGRDGADGDFDGDGLANGQEAKFGTLLHIADCDGDGLKDGDETGYIAVSNSVPWLSFDQFEDCTVDLVYSTHRQYHVNRGLPCALSVQDELVTNITFSSYGWLYLNRAGLSDKWRSDGARDFTYAVDKDTLAIAAYGNGSMFVATNAAERSTVVRYGTATHDGIGYVVLEYENLYRELSNYRTNSISFQVVLPTNCADRVYVLYRNVTGGDMDGRNCGIGMQTFDGKWLHSYCYNKACKVYDGLGLMFFFGHNTYPLNGDSDADGLADGVEVDLGTSPNHADSDGDGMPDGWERKYGLDPLSADGEDGAWGDVDEDGLPNGLEYEYGTNPQLADTDGDGLADGQEVVDTFEDQTVPWVTLASPTDLTDAFSNTWECVNYALPSPIQVLRETVTNITIDAHGVIYLNRAGYDNRRYATYGYGLDYEIDGNCVVVAPYWSDLEIADIVGPSSIRVGTANIGTNECLVVEYANMYYRPNWDDETNAVSFQVAIPLGLADRISVKYANQVGERMDGRNAEIGFQTFGFRGYSQYCDYNYDMISEGMGLVFLLGYGTDPKRVDTDRDGLTDGMEVNEWGSDPCAADTDGDGVADGVEVEIGTSSVNADSDGDGLSDGWERDHGLDPLSSIGDDGANGDPDNDGLMNIQEQTYGGDPNKADTDEDGLIDGREVALGTGVAVADTDGDGLSDGAEDTLGTDPRRMDSDGDGLSDGWEVANNFNPLTPSGSTGEAAADTDGDGLTNLQEMQLGTNPRLADTDGDGLNDGAEVAAGTNPANADTDGDGLDDRYETETAGLDPLRPDSDRDGMPDGWEVANGLDPTSAVGADGADGDLDGDGLSNLDEYRNNCNPRVRDTDGDGVNDNVEVANGSDPADASDCGIKPSEDKFREINFNITGDWAAWDLSIVGQGPNDYRTIHVTMGAPNAPATTTARLRKNNSYRLSMKWLNCDGHDDSSSAPWYCWQALIDGKPSVQTFDSYSSARKEGVANLIVGTGWIAENEDGLLTAHIHENSESGGNVAEGKVAMLHVFDIEHDLLWETENKCNKILNNTPKDDSSSGFNCETISLGGKQCSFAIHRNFLYVAASVGNKIKVTEKVKVAQDMRPVFNRFADRFLCGAFRNGEIVDGSQTQLSAANLSAALEFDGTPDEVAEELQIRVGIDVDEDGELSYEESAPLEVCKIRGAPAYATVKAISKTKYEAHKEEINGQVYYSALGLIPDNPPNLIAPHARSFLKLFYEPESQETLSRALWPTGTGSFRIDVFSNDASCFAEWLTHNCGANIPESGVVDIPRYEWNDTSEVSRFMAQRTPFALKTSMIVDGSYCEYLTDTGRRLLQFYNNRVKDVAERILQNLSDGEERTFPSANEWYGVGELVEAGVFTSLSPSWVPGLTLNIGSSSNYSGYDAAFVQATTGNPAFDDFDAFGTVGRGRVLSPRYRFTVRKVVPWIGKTRYEVVNVKFECAIEDLYDFNYEDSDLAANAAALQIGYRKDNRQNGRIYMHHINISVNYPSPFSFSNLLMP